MLMCYPHLHMKQLELGDMPDAAAFYACFLGKVSAAVVFLPQHDMPDAVCFQ